jgi:hypothetical protein
LDAPLATLWATPDFDYAAGYAELHDSDVVWALTMDLADADILDLTPHGLDATAVAAALTSAGMHTGTLPGEKSGPQCALRRVSVEKIPAAGYGAVRIRERIDWGSGPQCAVSLRIADLTAIVRREAIPLPAGKNFQMGGLTNERKSSETSVQPAEWDAGSSARPALRRTASHDR